MPCHLPTGCGAVGSAPGWGPGGRWFKSSHPDMYGAASGFQPWPAVSPHARCSVASGVSARFWRIVAARDSRILRQIPNALTLGRLCCVPVFIALMVLGGGSSLAAGLVFLAAAMTDFLDGQLARRLGVMSQFGKIADPLADRLLVNSAVIMLCFHDSRLFGWEWIVVVLRDAAALYGYSRLRQHLLVPDVTFTGKLGMASNDGRPDVAFVAATRNMASAVVPDRVIAFGTCAGTICVAVPWNAQKPRGSGFRLAER